MKIGFSSNNSNLFSWLIRLVTKSKWSHCFVVVGPLGNDELIMEASFHGGVKFNLLSSYKKSKYSLELIQLGSDFNIDPLLQFFGNEYGVKQIVGSLIARIFKLKNNPITEDEVCSELVMYALLQSSYADKFADYDPNNISPQDIYEVLSG